MLSLARTINRMDRKKRLYRTALGCYLAAIALLQEYPIEADAEVSRTYKSVLRQIQTGKSPTVANRKCWSEAARH